MTFPINRRLMSDDESLSADETNQVLDYLADLGQQPGAYNGEVIGRGEGGQPVMLREDEIVVNITGVQNGSLYEWVQCYPYAVKEDGTPGTLTAAPAGSTDEPTTPKGTLKLLPAYEIKGRTDVPKNTRVFLRKSRRGQFYEFHYDGAASYYGAGGTVMSSVVLVPLFRYACLGTTLYEYSYTLMLSGPGLVGVIY